LDPREAAALLARLQQAGVRLETVHFHLRTNVASARIYGQALREIRDLCAAARFAPKHLDIGGGLPPPHVLSRDGRRYDAGFSLRDWAAMLERSVQGFPGLRELWLENGRFVSARSGVLVVTVLDIKERRGQRQLICDGGRTMNALVANWESHALLVLPPRRGPRAATTVYGPTCMAFDQLARRPLPRTIRPGDRLVWLDAGAYHIPWETRFSHGSATVLWHQNNRLHVARAAESFATWWGQWTPAASAPGAARAAIPQCAGGARRRAT
jgi:diaminopimelate decarboxylase